MAHMGVGEATGPNKALEAAKMAIASPLLETSISGANGILVSITVSPGVELDEADQASTMITEEAAANANIIWGVNFDETLEDTVKVTIIATGFDKKVAKKIGDDEEIDIVVPKDVSGDDDIDEMLKIVNESRRKSVSDDFNNKY